MCLRVLADRSELMSKVFGEQSRQILANMLACKEDERKKDKTVGLSFPQAQLIIVHW